MSGFAGNIHFDGAPLDRELLERMTRATERHGGDAFNIHCQNNAGFGHSLLRTMHESENEQQPCSFDGKTWIVGDVRIDARQELITKLKARGRDASLLKPDIELVLHAFHAWGEKCVDHIIGDFAFTIWDVKANRAFCARDHFGVKPFYYFHKGETFVFANDIEALRPFPGIRSELNEAAIGDFLAFGLNLDEKTTFYQDIARLPPGHSLSIEQGVPPRLLEYRQMAVSSHLNYAQPEMYAEHFLELLTTAVSDRLRTRHVGLELSGGLDSNSVAAVAALLGKTVDGFSAIALTTDYSHRDPLDEEARYAAEAAAFHHFKHRTIEAGHQQDFYAHCKTHQPYAWPFAATSLRFANEIKSEACVLLSGQGSDPFQHGSGYKLLDDYRDTPMLPFAAKQLKQAIKLRSIRKLNLQQLFAGDSPRLFLPEIPRWVADSLARKAQSEERWKALYYRPGRYPRGCRYEEAWDELHMPSWSHLFEDYYHDLFSGIDCRHPMFDTRMIQFLFSIPASVKYDKKLMRHSMLGLMPENIRTRPKSVLSRFMVKDSLSSNLGFDASRVSLPLTEKWLKPDVYRKLLIEYARNEGGDHFTSITPISLEKWITIKQVVK